MQLQIDIFYLTCSEICSSNFFSWHSCSSWKTNVSYWVLTLWLLTACNLFPITASNSYCLQSRFKTFLFEESEALASLGPLLTWVMISLNEDGIRSGRTTQSVDKLRMNQAVLKYNLQLTLHCDNYPFLDVYSSHFVAFPISSHHSTISYCLPCTIDRKIKSTLIEFSSCC